MINPLVPVNTISALDGSHLNINLERLAPGSEIESFVTASLQNLMALGFISQLPEVSYDPPSQTAFLYYSNPFTGGETYQKVVVKENVAYVASANVNTLISDPQRVQELVNMVATFTLIGT